MPLPTLRKARLILRRKRRHPAGMSTCLRLPPSSVSSINASFTPMFSISSVTSSPSVWSGTSNRSASNFRATSLSGTTSAAARCGTHHVHTRSPLTPHSHNMRSHSILVYHLLLLLLIFLLAFASHRAAADVVPDSEVARKLEADLFEVPDHTEGEEVTEEMENMGVKEALIDETDEGGRRRHVLMPAGWRRFRRRISRAFRRVGDGIRRVFREPWKVCLGKCPHGRKSPVLLTA
ncbi:hypothetical protein ECG_03047 [Echinococcus granulosus]|nr:hypothetical protein ECG_03047 [Echinococcus granulosus]